jgi:hypothetical protein
MSTIGAVENITICVDMLRLIRFYDQITNQVIALRNQELRKASTIINDMFWAPHLATEGINRMFSILFHPKLWELSYSRNSDDITLTIGCISLWLTKDEAWLPK